MLGHPSHQPHSSHFRNGPSSLVNVRGKHRLHMTWTDEWSCAVDDDCPSCGRNSSPEDSTLRIPATYEQLFDLLPEIPW